MYLSELRIWNFRKYGYTELSEKPAITVNFKKGLNVLIGENDSGKTAIIDAIKFILGTKSHDNLKLKEKDFYLLPSGERSKELKLECIFRELSEEEAGSFLEWICFDRDGNAELQARFIAKIKDSKIFSNTAAGLPDLDTRFDANELLRATYLKPLRDAENELSQGYHSRLAQVLGNHPIFQKGTEEHTLEKYFRVVNEKIETYFREEKLDKDDKFNIEDGEDGAKEITEQINNTLERFMGTEYQEKGYQANISISRNELSYILKKLSLVIAENQVGLGSLNQLFIALELLLFHIEEKYNIALIEEIEAHLHPQAQLRLIDFLQEKRMNENLQFVISTHSITLASKIQLDNLILCKENKVYSLGKEYTKLSSGDYKFLERFLNATKANMFFSKGILFVEGDAENLIIPVIAQIIECPLEKYGVSVVNVGSLAFMRYTNIFKRIENDLSIEIPIAVITDLDIKPEICNELEFTVDSDGKVTGTTIYSCIKLMGDLSLLETNYNPIKLKELQGRIFTNKDALLAEIKKISNIDSYHRLPGFQAALEEYIEEKNDIELLTAAKTYEKRQQYETDYAKLFTNKWTLEYDMGLSNLRTYMYAAIRIAKKVRNNENIIEDINLNEELSEAIEQIDIFKKNGFSDEKVAYLIYEDLFKKNASKAVAAQYLCELLKENVDLVKDIIKSDTHIAYLTKAIKYVCKIGGGGDARAI